MALTDSRTGSSKIRECVRSIPRLMVCPAGMDSAICLTPDQAESIAMIYEGLRDPATGEQIWPGYEPGSEDGWGGHIGEPFFISQFYFQTMVFNDPEWDWREFINNDEYFDAIREAHERFAPVIAAIDPDLSAFRANGGKMVFWHGWDDQNIAPRNEHQLLRGRAGRDRQQGRNGRLPPPLPGPRDETLQ